MVSTLAGFWSQHWNSQHIGAAIVSNVQERTTCTQIAALGRCLTQKRLRSSCRHLVDICATPLQAQQTSTQPNKSPVARCGECAALHAAPLCVTPFSTCQDSVRLVLRERKLVCAQQHAASCREGCELGRHCFGAAQVCRLLASWRATARAVV